MRFDVAALVLACLLPFSVLPQSADSNPTLRVIMLGTGGPELTADRAGYATLIEAGGQKLLFDAGRNVLQRLYESQVNVTDVTRVFITHLHNDHIEGLPSLWMTPWFLLGRDQPMAIWGPPGTQQMIAGMRAMYKFDLDHRVNQFNKLANLDWTVAEIGAGVVYRQGGVTISAFTVEHDDGNPAFGYRIDYRGRSVVLSGDTTYSESVVRAGRGVDLIVHNVIAVPSPLADAPEMKPIIGKLTTPEQAARVFKETRPRLAVFSHVVKKELSGQRGDDLILQRVRAAGYAGQLEMGHDRMIIDIADTIRIAQPSATDGLADVDRKAAYQ